MNASAAYHEKRRDELMQVARHFRAHRDTDMVRRCVTHARLHNHLAMMHRNPQRHAPEV